mmetsp:Transcript_6467/g.26196  ORF Transcript_6467/g.26196 Transcript_6467/m.26196 type:complete len:200 (-) Transcript_6467:3703-4302(-)
MKKYCKLNLTYRDFRPYAYVHSSATREAFSEHGHTGLNTPLIWTLGEFHITGIDAVLRKLDKRLYGFIQSTLPTFFLAHATNNPEIIKGSGVNLISYINKTFGTLTYEDSTQIQRQLNEWPKLSVTSSPLNSLNAFHEKYLLYQDIISPKNGNTLTVKQREQTIKRAMVDLLGDDYGREHRGSHFLKRFRRMKHSQLLD